MIYTKEEEEMIVEFRRRKEIVKEKKYNKKNKHDSKMNTLNELGQIIGDYERLPNKNKGILDQKIAECIPKNRDSPIFLGVYIAEEVLSRVFKNVERTPLKNRGYDFICNHGKKIDVKASCTSKRETQSNSWTFVINKNYIADYFLCLAFDNRENLNPLHLWLLPGNLVNKNMSISISKSSIHKWDNYRLNIDNLVSCCNTMRE